MAVQTNTLSSHPFLFISMIATCPANLKLYHHLSLSFFEKIRLPDIPKDIPRHTPIPIPAMLFKTFIKTTLQSIAAVIPIVTPIIILLLFISFILHKFRFVFFFLKMGNPDWNCPYILKIMRFLRLCTVSSTIWCKFGVFVYFQSFFTNEVHPVL